jgi:hypothetical protein
VTCTHCDTAPVDIQESAAKAKRQLGSPPEVTADVAQRVVQLRATGATLAAMRRSPHLAAELARYRNLLEAEVKRRAGRGRLAWSCCPFASAPLGAANGRCRLAAERVLAAKHDEVTVAPAGTA